MKIYIIGSPGSGKTYFANKLSKKHKIKSYQLDKVVWDDDNGNIKRTNEEANKIFEGILKKHNWIIEDVGREKFKKGREKADIIYYIKFDKSKAYISVIKRWFRQRTGKEIYNAPPTIDQLGYFCSVVKSYYKKEKRILNELKEFNNKLVFISREEINKL